MANKSLLFGALLMMVAAVFVAYYGPKAQEAMTAKERAERLSRESVADGGATASSTQQQQQQAPKKNESDPAPSATTKKLSADEVLARFVDALQNKANVALSNLNIRAVSSATACERFPEGEQRNRCVLEADQTYTGARITAARDIAAGETVVELPTSLQFNERSMHSQLRKGLEKLSSEHELLRQLFVNQPALTHDFQTLLSLLMQMRQKEKSPWAPFLATLPGGSFVQDSFGLFLTEDEQTCLSPFDKRLLDELFERRDRLVNITRYLCDTMPAEETEEQKQKKSKTPERLVQLLACHTSEEHMSWAFALLMSRQVSFGDLPSLFPVMDMLPYAIDANVRPGMINTNDDGQYVSVSLVSAKPIKEGDEFYFRLGIRHGSDVFLSQGFHHSRHFDPHGVMLPFVWSEAVQNISRNTLRCGEAEATFTIRGDGGVSDDLWRCAELEAIRRVLKEAVNPTKTEEDAAAPSSAAVDVTETQLSEELSRRGLPSDLRLLPVSPSTKTELKNLVKAEYSVEGGGCGLTPECQQRRLCRQLMEHNAYVGTVVDHFVSEGEEASSP